MSQIKTLYSFTLTFFLCVFCTVPGMSNESENESFELSTKSVVDSSATLSDVRPKLAMSLQMQFVTLLGSNGPLGSLGPLGAYGPLGTLGPIGNQVWNVSEVMSTLGDWSDFSQYLTLKGGPLSSDGPLGPKGPLSPQALRLMNSQPGFISHLGAGGLFTTLGPFGPLGPMGPLGPLGPTGAHGLQVNAQGEYLKGQSIQRSISVQDGQQKMIYELFEHYPEQTAKKMTNNDTSFMVSGRLESAKSGYETDSFTFTASENKLVTVVVTPEYALDQFSAKITSIDGRQSFVSDTPYHINFIQFFARKGVRYQLDIALIRTNHFFSKNYRAIVTSSPSALAQTQFSGPYLRRTEKTNCQSVL